MINTRLSPPSLYFLWFSKLCLCRDFLRFFFTLLFCLWWCAFATFRRWFRWFFWYAFDDADDYFRLHYSFRYAIFLIFSDAFDFAFMPLRLFSMLLLAFAILTLFIDFSLIFAATLTPDAFAFFFSLRYWFRFHDFSRLRFFFVCLITTSLRFHWFSAISRLIFFFSAISLFSSCRCAMLLWRCSICACARSVEFVPRVFSCADMMLWKACAWYAAMLLAAPERGCFIFADTRCR